VKRWEVAENYTTETFREFELVFEHKKKFVRLYSDGRLEVGEKNSPFVAEYSMIVKEE
jgi:hypothetical protein